MDSFFTHNLCTYKNKYGKTLAVSISAVKIIILFLICGYVCMYLQVNI